MDLDSRKLPGKTEFSGRRRATTRKSGFKSHPESTGSELKIEQVAPLILRKGQTLNVTFTLPEHVKGDFLGFGGYFSVHGDVSIDVKGGSGKLMITEYGFPSWNKVGSFWVAQNSDPVIVKITFTARSDSEIALYGLQCGIVYHKYLKEARSALIPNMHEFAPETLFIDSYGEVAVAMGDERDLVVGESGFPIYLKSCNRCARFLPINYPRERDHLSFSNHCVAEHRRPCSHGGFGKLTNISTKEVLNLDYGFQLECRFCKKFEVNAAHNPKRTAAQMKEDAARRRGFELLLTHLLGESPQLRYRHQTGKELVDDVYEKFAHKCFKCGYEFRSAKEMHLDHTRPLALLWPLDGTATALCKDCNSRKRDRPPSEFYTAEELKRLSKITGIALEDLVNPSPNLDAVNLLLKKLDWLFEVFLRRSEMMEIRDGKLTGELLVKALQKVLSKYPCGAPVDLVKMLHQRRT
jgi:hypothetical protein